MAIAWAAGSGLGTGWFFAHPPHGADGLRDLVATLEAGGSGEDAVLVAPAILMPSLAQYTTRRLTGIPDDFDLRDIYSPFAIPATDAEVRAATRSAMHGHDVVWLVVRDEMEVAGTVIAELSTCMTATRRVPTEFATLLRFEAARCTTIGPLFPRGSVP